MYQAASFNYDMLYKVARAISDEVRAKVAISSDLNVSNQCIQSNCDSL